MTTVGQWPLFIAEDGSLSLQKLLAKARLLIRQEKLGLSDWSTPKTKSSAATISVDNAVIARVHRLKTLTVDVRAGLATRHYKVVKSAEPQDLVFQSVKDGRPMNDGNI